MSSSSSASIPLQLEESGKVIKVGVALNNNNNEQQDGDGQTPPPPTSAVSAGMLRAMIQSRFGEGAQLCTQDGVKIPDSEIIWSRDNTTGDVSVKPKLQISSSTTTSSAAESRPESNANVNNNNNNQNQEQQQPPTQVNRKMGEEIEENKDHQQRQQQRQSSVTESEDDRIARELTQQVHQRERQLHVARTLLDTDRLKWNQQLDILRQLRDTALKVIQTQREEIARVNNNKNSSSSNNSTQELAKRLKEQQRIADEIVARQEVKRLEILQAEKAMSSIQSDIDRALGEVDISSKPQHAAAPQFFKDEILKIACNQVYIDSIENDIEAIQSELSFIRQKRRGLIEDHEDIKGHVRVVVRQRPYLDLVDGIQPKRLGAPEVGDIFVDEQNRVVSVSSPATGQRDFEFVNTFGPQEQEQEQEQATPSLLEKQIKIFDSEIVPLLRESIAKGTDSNFLLYGATGSGKTFTVFGNPTHTEQEDCPGLLEMALSEIVEFAGEADVQASELYLDQRTDLLDPTTVNNNSNKKQSSTTSSSFMKNTNNNNSSNNNNNCCWVRINTVKHGVRLIRKAALRRVTAKTLTNEVSSRSHMIVSIRFPVLSGDGKIHHVTVTFVDLAGSERVGRSLSSGDRLKEAQHINRSLSALGDVVQALATHSNHIPYRNSKLTQLLQNALGGSSRTLLMLCIPPHLPEQHNMSEIVSTLSFGVRARGIRNK